MNKRGVAIEERLGFWIFYGVILAIILLGLFNYINNLADKTTFNQDYLARDVAFVLNTVYTSPGDIEVSYFVPEKKDFVFIIGEGLVTVRKKDDVLNKKSYPYHEDMYIESNLDEKLEIKDSVAILFSKEGDTLTVTSIQEKTNE